MSHTIITCAGYGNSGSSAITNIFQEIPSVLIIGGSEFEFTLLHETDGIIDLYNILTEGNRLKSDAAIKRFINLVYRLNSYSPTGKNYSSFFNNKFLSYTLDYLRDLGVIKWNGWWHRIFDFTEENCLLDNYKRKLFNKYTKKKTYSLYEQDSWRPCFTPCDNMFYCGISKESFITKTKLYLTRLFDECDIGNKYEYIYFDQLVPANCDEVYLQFFDKLKVFIVDRDPRDIYFANQVFWNSKYIPTDNVFDYIEWFKITRGDCFSSESIMYLKFEDLIYNYEVTVGNILKFVDIKNIYHTNKKTVFLPEESKNNTRLWERYIINDNNINDNIIVISQKLKLFCFDYSKINENIISKKYLIEPIYKLDNRIQNINTNLIKLLVLNSLYDIIEIQKNVFLKILCFPILFLKKLLKNIYSYVCYKEKSKNKYCDFNL